MKYYDKIISKTEELKQFKNNAANELELLRAELYKKIQPYNSGEIITFQKPVEFEGVFFEKCIVKDGWIYGDLDGMCVRANCIDKSGNITEVEYFFSTDNDDKVISAFKRIKDN